MRRKIVPSNWMLMIHILRLYKDVNQLIQLMGHDGKNGEIKAILRKIIGRLKVLNILGSNIPWYFLTFLPLDLLISSNDRFEKRRALKHALLSLRNSLEKMIVGRISYKFLRRKEAYINFRNPVSSLCVPSSFDEFIPGYVYIPGRKPVLLTAAHAAPPASDINTELLSRRVAMRSGAHALISRIPRLYIDPNRLVGRVLPFRRKLDELINNRKIRLIIDLHSMEKRNSNMVEIGIWFGLSTTGSYVEKLIEFFERNNISYEISYRYLGGDIIFYHANKPRINAIQLEISNGIRGRCLRLLCRTLISYINAVGDINRRGKSS